LLALLIVWKGGSAKIKLSDEQSVGVAFGVGGAVAVIVATFFIPFLHRRIIMEDWELKGWEVIKGPLLLRRPQPAPKPEGVPGIRDFYAGHLTAEQLEAKRAGEARVASEDIEKGVASSMNARSDGSESDITTLPSIAPANLDDAGRQLSKPRKCPLPGLWYTTPAVAWYWVKYAALHGVEQDVVDQQKHKDFLSGDIEKVHATGEHYDNRAEYTYSFLQVLTASTTSFAHGANDVSNAIGPYTTIYFIWSTAKISTKVPVPLWILAFGGAGIVVGLWTYGYKITLHSPARGFSMELGAAITIIMATKLALPVSTTQCITGATVGVGLCNGTWRTINWRMVAWIYFGWFVTLPCAGIISGCLMGIVLNAPRWGSGV
jgi:sodium-dependent phosphate transporter